MRCFFAGSGEADVAGLKKVVTLVQMEDAKDETEDRKPEAAESVDDVSEGWLITTTSGSLPLRGLLREELVKGGGEIELRSGGDDGEPN